jgi:hypothetical protein
MFSSLQCTGCFVTFNSWWMKHILSCFPHRSFRFHFICCSILFKCLDLKAFCYVIRSTYQLLILHDPKRQFDQLIYRSKRDSFVLMLIILALRDFISQYISINGTAIGPINAFCGNDGFPIFLLAIECLPAREAPLSIFPRNPVRCDHFCYDHWPHLRCAFLFSHLGWSGISKGEEARPRSEERRRATELSASSIHGATNR